MTTYTIYYHTNKIAKKSYVGYTHHDMMKRWNGHVESARGKGRVDLSIAIREYGESDEIWDHIILAQCQSIYEAKEAEKFYIAKLNTLKPNGYNMTPGGSGVILITEEDQEKHRQRTKAGMYRPDVRARHLAAQGNPTTKKLHAIATAKSWKDPTSRANHRKGWEASTKVKRYGVVQLDRKTNEMIAQHKSIREACRVTGVAKTTLHAHLQGKLQHAGGFVWRRVV